MLPRNGSVLLLLLWLSAALVTSAQEFKRDSPPVPCTTPDINVTYYGDLVEPQCTNFTKVNGFNPHCLPATLRNYTFLSGRGKGKEPQVYNTWMFAETCGLRMTAWRAINQMPRRTVIFKAAEAVLQNWGTYIAGLTLGVLSMNVFYVSARGARCWGIFRDGRPCWGITYKKAVALIEILFLVPTALMVLVGCVYQFIHLEVGRRDALAALMTPVCYSNNIQDYAPFPQCKEVLRLDWVCNESMMKVMLLGVFAIMDLFIVLMVSVFTCYYCCASISRICCCCCGGQYWWACWRRPECICGPHFNCGTCMSWICCHGLAKSCCCCFIPFVLTLYFIVGMFGSLLAYGLLLFIFAALVYCITWLLKVCIALACPWCSILPIPSYWSEYLVALSLHPSSFIQSFGNDENYEKQRVMAEMYDEKDNDYTEWDIDEPGYEARIMGTPCPQVTMLAMPMLILIICVPIVVVLGVAGYSFILQDWLMETLAWAESDMRWYYTSTRMGPWYKMWQYLWQVFLELASGLTDAFGEIFQAWWWGVKSPLTGDKVFWNQAMSFLEHGSNPANLFQTEYFFKFRQGVIFWRFCLAFFFAVARSIAMVNMPFERFMDMRNQGHQFDELRNWDMPAEYMPEDPSYPYGHTDRGI